MKIISPPSINDIGIFAINIGGTFIQRWDLYAKQLADGSYICIHKPLSIDHIISHLAGKLTLGAYILDLANRVRFTVFDADSEEEMKKLLKVSKYLSSKGIPSYLEASRRGGHLWIFFEGPVTGRLARSFALGLLTKFGGESIEIFPKQEQLRGGPGSLIRLPFGVHQRTGKRYEFITSEGYPLAHSIEDQIRLLTSPKTLSRAKFDIFKKYMRTKPGKSIEKKIRSRSRKSSEKVNNRFTVFDFVGQYVDLSPSGRGLCPFHDDHKMSFSVNKEENYWHCFAGCGGGSIIDFWMAWNNFDFHAALNDLKLMLPN